MKIPTHFSRRALFAGGTALVAAPLLASAIRERIPLLTQARGVPDVFLMSLVERLETHFERAGRKVRVEPVIAKQHRELASLAHGINGDALLFAGSTWSRAWRQALSSSARVVQITLGEDVKGEGSEISASSWQALELGGAWSAKNLGPRGAVLVSAEQSASDLPFAFEHGLERAGGQIVRRVVALPGRASEAWNALEGEDLDVVAVLASGSEAAALWRTAPPRLATLTHAWSGGQGRSHVVHSASSSFDSLSERVVAQVQGRSMALPTLHLTSPSGVVTSLGTADTATLANHSTLSLRNRSTFPFTGC